MKESSIEKKFREDLQKLGCLVFKFVSPGNDGVPDRIVVTPRGRTIYVELKTKGGSTSELQKEQISRLTKHHAEVFVLYGEYQAEEFIRWVREGLVPHDF